MLAKIFIICSLTLAVIGSENVLPDDDCEDISSKSCQNFNTARQRAIDQRIKKMLQTSYTYMSMGAYFSRDDPNYKGFAKFFYTSSVRLRDDALKLIDYQNLRGGVVSFHHLQKPPVLSDTVNLTGLKALADARDLERVVNEKLLKLHAHAHNDPQMQYFLESNYLKKQVKIIRKVSGYINELTHLKVVNPDLAEHIFNEKLEEEDD